MVCYKCKNDGVFNSIAGKDFYYCRTCKEEILLESPPSDAKSKLPGGFKLVKDFSGEYECDVPDCSCHFDTIKRSIADLFKGVP